MPQRTQLEKKDSTLPSISARNTARPFSSRSLIALFPAFDRSRVNPAPAKPGAGKRAARDKGEAMHQATERKIQQPQLDAETMQQA